MNLMTQHEINSIELISALIQVRSYFAKTGIKVKVTRKKTTTPFTSGLNYPIVIKDAAVPNLRKVLPF